MKMLPTTPKYTPNNAFKTPPSQSFVECLSDWAAATNMKIGKTTKSTMQMIPKRRMHTYDSQTEPVTWLLHMSIPCIIYITYNSKTEPVAWLLHMSIPCTIYVTYDSQIEPVAWMVHMSISCIMYIRLMTVPLMKRNGLVPDFRSTHRVQDCVP